MREPEFPYGVPLPGPPLISPPPGSPFPMPIIQPGWGPEQAAIDKMSGMFQAQYGRMPTEDEQRGWLEYMRQKKLGQLDPSLYRPWDVAADLLPPGYENRPQTGYFNRQTGKWEFGEPGGGDELLDWGLPWPPSPPGPPSPPQFPVGPSPFPLPGPPQSPGGYPPGTGIPPGAPRTPGQAPGQGQYAPMGRHLPYRQTRYDLRYNPSKIAALESMFSWWGQRPEDWLGEFQAYGPKGAVSPLTRFF